MNKTRIEWCDYTWNPVTGCKRGCTFCYARRIHERFNNKNFSDIIEHPTRLYEPKSLKKPSKIFVGSMSDIQYWKTSYLEKVINVCNSCPKHTFMFLTKEPRIYVTVRIEYGHNIILGTTITSGVPPYVCGLKRQFLSIEPLLGPIKPGFFGFDLHEMVIVGAMTGPGSIKPKPEWIDSVKKYVPKDKLFLKNSIKPYWEE